MLSASEAKYVLSQIAEILHQQVVKGEFFFAINSGPQQSTYDNDLLLHMVLQEQGEPAPFAEYQFDHYGSRVSISVRLGTAWHINEFVVDTMSSDISAISDPNDLVEKMTHVLDDYSVSNVLLYTKDPDNSLLYKSSHKSKKRASKLKLPWMQYCDSYASWGQNT